MATLARSAKKAVRDGEKTVKKTVAKAGKSVAKGQKTVVKASTKVGKSARALATKVADKITGRDKKKKAIKRVATGAAVAAATLAVAGIVMKKRAKKR